MWLRCHDLPFVFLAWQLFGDYAVHIHHPTPDPIKLNDLRSIEAFAAENAAVLSVATLRWQLRHRDTNGLASACIQIGKRLFISKSRYEFWLATQTEEGRAAA